MRLFSLALVVLSLLAAPLTLHGQAAVAQEPQRAQQNGTSAAEVEAQVFMSTLQAISRLHQTPFSDSTLWNRALDGLIEAIDDPYASVFTPEEAEQFEETNTGNYAGIGVQISELNETVTITGVFRSTPADEAGLQVGDVIVGVNENDATGWSSAMVSDSVRGPVGTEVRVRVERDGYDAPLAFPITRAQVHVPAVTADYLPDNILYVGMDRVARGSAQEMDSVLRQYDDAAGIILDLRRNPGGYLDESLTLADLFLPPGKRLASTRSRDPSGRQEFYEESWNARMRARQPETPVIVLVDEFPASASEILAGALQDYDRALILGQRTFGKGVVQTVLDLPYGRRLRLTTGAWYTPLGRSLHRTRDEQRQAEDEGAPGDSLPTILSEAGRELVAAGGIFPDLTIAYDTLTLRERELLQGAAEAEVPLPLRLAEFGFAQARALTDEGAGPELRDDAFLEFLQAMEDEGVPAELLEDPELQDYLSWRARIAIADRMDRLGEAALVRMERDTVLEEAVRLLTGFPDQIALFDEARRLRALRTAEGAATGAEDPAGGSRPE
jgi:carboxyl-terminal processing protease